MLKNSSEVNAVRMKQAKQKGVDDETEEVQGWVGDRSHRAREATVRMLALNLKEVGATGGFREG